MNIVMTEKLKNAKGFTLIEIIAALVMLGALGVAGTMALANVIEGYQWAKDNAHLSQKAQVALTRIATELNYATDVQITGNTIRYDAEYPDDTTSAGNRIGLPGGQTVLRLSLDPPLGQGYILADNVTDFAPSLSNNHLIAIELRMQGVNGAEKTFTTSIAVR